MSAILSSTSHAIRSLATISDLKASVAAKSESLCVGHDVYDLQSAVRRLMDRSDDELSDEARTILSSFAALGWRCRNLWRAT